VIASETAAQNTRPNALPRLAIVLGKPTDEDDHAISPFRDFVVLTPSWADKDPEALIPLAELNKRGILASHKDEPAVMSLVPVNPAYKTFPWPVADDRGFCTLQVRLEQQLDGKVIDLPLALIIVRPMYENEGS